MEFLFRADIIMSKELSIEAENLSDAMDQAKEMMAGPQKIEDFKLSKVQYELLNFAIG